MSKRVIINEKYVHSIQEDLIKLDDYIPLKALDGTDTEFGPKRWEFLRAIGKDEEMGARYRKARIKYNRLPSGEDVDFMAKEVLDFVNKYPQWSNIIGSLEKT